MPGTPTPRSDPKSQFNATNFARDVLRLDWGPIYSTMSAMARSNFPRVASSLRRIEDREGEPELFGLTFEDDAATLEFAASFLPFLLAAHTRFVVERLVGDTVVKRPEQLSVARESVEWASFMLSTNEKAIWRAAAADLDYLSTCSTSPTLAGTGRRSRRRGPLSRGRAPPTLDAVRRRQVHTPYAPGSKADRIHRSRSCQPARGSTSERISGVLECCLLGDPGH